MKSETPSAFKRCVLLLGWTAVNVAVAYLIVYLYGLFDIKPSQISAVHPVLGILIVFPFLLISVGFVMALRKFLSQSWWSRSPTYSNLSLGTLVAAAAIGLLPIAIHAMFCIAIYDASTSARPAGQFPCGNFVGLTGMCLLNAFVEELVYRTTAIGLMSRKQRVWAFIVPTLFFALAHFLESGRAVEFWRVTQLCTVSLLLYLVALHHGLLAATLTHTFSNLSIYLTGGAWSIGAVLNVEWPQGDARLTGDTVSYATAIVVYLLLHGVMKGQYCNKPRRLPI